MFLILVQHPLLTWAKSRTDWGIWRADHSFQHSRVGIPANGRRNPGSTCSKQAASGFPCLTFAKSHALKPERPSQPWLTTTLQGICRLCRPTPNLGFPVFIWSFLATALVANMAHVELSYSEMIRSLRLRWVFKGKTVVGTKGHKEKPNIAKLLN